jgi:hypothetical protein
LTLPGIPLAGGFPPPAPGNDPTATNQQTGLLYISMCANACTFFQPYIAEIATTSSGLQVASQIPLDKFVFNIAVNPATNMIYLTSLQNLLIEINGMTNQIVDEIPFTAYANVLWGIAVDPLAYEIFLAGSPLCQGLSDCGANILYVVSAQNYGIFATFVASGSFVLQFNPANNETYILYSNLLQSVRIPQYNSTIVEP